MKTLEQIKDTLISEKSILESEYGVTSIGIFGSYVRNEQTPDSDVDVLVDMKDGKTLFDLLRLEYYLSDALGVKADVVLRDGIKKRLADRILKEVVYL